MLVPDVWGRAPLVHDRQPLMLPLVDLSTGLASERKVADVLDDTHVMRDDWSSAADAQGHLARSTRVLFGLLGTRAEALRGRRFMRVDARELRASYVLGVCRVIQAWRQASR